MAYTKQTFVDNETVLSAAHMDHIEDGIADISYFGMRYSEVTEIIDLSESGDESVKMYLFPNADGYDAVVEGTEGVNGAIRDFTTTESRTYDIQKINRLYIGDSVTSIGNYFMYQAFNLKKLSFANSKSITRLGKNCFAYTSIDGTYEFTGLNQGTLEGPFESCLKLKGLTFNSGVTEITEYSFQMCIALQYVKGLSGVISIGNAAFQYCHSLATLDVIPANVSLGKWAFILTPTDAKVDGTNTKLCDATWQANAVGDTSVRFTQNTWSPIQLENIKKATAASVQMPIPESDTQNTEFYDSDLKYFWTIVVYKGTLQRFRTPARRMCWAFVLFHIYNVLHPNAQYDTYYDFMTREIAPRKLTVTKAMHDNWEIHKIIDPLTGDNRVESETILDHLRDLTELSYDIGTEISVADLPLSLDSDGVTEGEVGTAQWGMLQALGWDSTIIRFETNDNGTFTDDCGQKMKQLIIDELSAMRPVYLSIIGADDSARHGVAIIGYNDVADKFLVVDSTGRFDHDVAHLSYWCAFESMVNPVTKASVRTFDFGEVITMTDIDNKLTTLMSSMSSGFRIESGELFVPKSIDTACSVNIPCTSGAKMLEFYADADTLTTLKNLPNTNTTRYTASALLNFFSTNIQTHSGIQTSFLMARKNQGEDYGYLIDGATCASSSNTDGASFKVFALLAGTYTWRAFYWNDNVEATPVWTGGSY